jgi:hypothetical protein
VWHALKLPANLKLQQGVNFNRWDGGPNKFYEQIDSVLIKGEPVTISGDVQMLYADRWSKERLEVYGSGDHSALIVGVGFNAINNRCEYLIRNSWGADWADNGYITVSRKSLVTYGQDFEYFEHKKPLNK